MKRFKGYIADHNGRTKGNDGRTIVYKAGVLIEAKEGELDHVGTGMVPVYEGGDVSPTVPDVKTSHVSSSDVETRPVKPAPRKSSTKTTRKRKASTAKK